MRIFGLSSGLDIDSIVKQLMMAERSPLNKVNQQKQLTTWKREEYRQVSTNLVSFNNKLSNYSLSSSIEAKKAVVTGASNVLTATATGSAANSVLNVQVNSLATASSVVYSGPEGATKMSDLYSGTESSVTINGKEITFDPDDSIESFVNKINSSKETGVTAVFDSQSGSLSLTSKSTGNTAIDLQGALFTDTTNSNLTKQVEEVGTNAEVVINGVKTQQSSNTFTVNGIQISLNGTTPTGQTTQIEVKQDVDKMMETITSFVNTYNETLALLNQKTNEERYRDYSPLTSDQKEEMTESEIELWEEKAKSGMLKNDSILNKTISEMRSALIADVVLPSGEKINLTQFGITTGSYSERGKLIIDETKLREALEANPEGAAALFGQTDSNATISNNDSDGIFNRIRKINAGSLQSLYDKAGTSKYSTDLSTSFLSQSEMGRQLDEFEKRITELTARLTRKENQYYKQFTAMETAMSKYNSVSSSLTSMFS